MMRPVSLAVPPKKPDGVVLSVVSVAKNGRSGTLKVGWNDNSIADTAYVVQRMVGAGAWTNLTTIQTPLDQPNTTGPMSYNDTTWIPTNAYQYRVVAQNTVGYGGDFPAMTVQSLSAAVPVPIPPPTALTAGLATGPRVTLTWTDNAVNETGFVIQRSTDGGTTFTQIGTAPARASTGSVTFTDSGVTLGSTYAYRVAAVNATAQSPWSNTVTIAVAVPAAPVIKSAVAARQGSGERVTVTWSAIPGVTGYTIQWSASQAFTAVAGSGRVSGTTFTSGSIARQTWYFRVIATNLLGNSPPSPVVTVASA